jgi:hypothetical protein
LEKNLKKSRGIFILEFATNPVIIHTFLLENETVKDRHVFVYLFVFVCPFAISKEVTGGQGRAVSLPAIFNHSGSCFIIMS